VTPERRDELAAKVALFPTGPGVYTWLDAKSRVVYVGKAKNLRARVRSYLRNDDDGRTFYRFLVRSVHDVACFETDTEKEALLLENTLIKRHRPRWNIKLNDDKSFLQIEVTTHAPWPLARLVRVSSRAKRGEVFGPYSSARAVRETLRHIKRWFPLRTCSDSELRQRTRPCIEHEMGRCTAPCVDLISPEDYRAVVDEVLLFLRGKNETLIPRLRGRMEEHAQALRYEQAARVRDQIRAIERTLEVQRVAKEGSRDQDLFGVASHDGLLVVLVVEVREGQVTEPRTYELRTQLELTEAFNAFLGQYYAAERYVPHEVILPFDLLQELLVERRGTKVELKVEVRGDRRSLLELAHKNAALALATGEEKRQLTREMLDGLQHALGLRRLPRRVECFDISTIQGSFTVASKVRFDDGDPHPEGYRTYKVRSPEAQQDDFAAMAEVVERRLRSGLEKGDLPDLIVIDGGPAQLGRALEAARRAGLPPQRTELVGLAKARAPKRGVGPEPAPGEPLAETAYERVHLPTGGPPIVLEPASLECRFLARVRDAAHRHAIRYHRELRRKSALRSGLEEVPGVGKKRRQQLLARFGSLKGIRQASLEELQQVVPAKVAQALREFLGAESAQ
jgi:excinuclease ABC subunit C